ncbi:hypothetical protein [Methanothermococcus okinawensis]|uniref:Uncharacterized protein n=1 Tax=Methanothermococcus okinawensis (strain DSM 14208 / JCM 11175 / IH1) TaxID=647113 RepID=F8AJL6_METOI|nr:hypothetical protein [Methanothermococcus okinawensis]AEH07202.1 hypothetical protein Metok_1234 [Methanothermococcus okinawensis IH1]
MIKVYRLDGVSGIIILLLLIILLIILAIILSPLFIGLILLILIYLGYKKFKKSINRFIMKIRKKKIKIKNESENGEVKIHFAKSISIEEEKDNNSNNTTKNVNDKDTIINVNKPLMEKEKEGIKKINEETEEFIRYLIEKGLKFENNLLYYNDKLVYPVYKKSYPINEIIRLYDKDNKPKTDAIILGLKGKPDKPKFIYIIPTEQAKERMSIDELRQYLINNL